MKKTTTILIVAFMVLSAVFLIAPANAAPDNANEKVQIRSPVIDGANFSDIFENNPMVQTESGRGYIQLTAKQFAGLYYEIDEDVATENIRLYNESKDGDKLLKGRTIEKKGLVYETSIENSNFECQDFEGDYPIMGLFAKKYIPLTNNTPGKLSKLIVDENDDYTLRTGEPLEIGNGYRLTATQIDTDGDKVWMEISKNDEILDDKIIDTSNGSRTWTYEEDVADEDDVDVMKVHVSKVFQGQTDSLVTINGLWMIDSDYVLEIENDDTFGNMESSIKGNSLKLVNDESITLSKDSVQDIVKGMKFKVANTENDQLRFYLMSEIMRSGTYEIRGSVSETAYSWSYKNFAGFYYDLENNKETETLEVKSLDGREIPENELVYKTVIKNVNFEADYGSEYSDTFPIIALFGEKYVPLASDTPDNLAKLVLDEDDKHTLKVGESVQLDGEYELTASQIDVDGDKARLKLKNGGNVIDDEIIDIKNGSAVWSYEKDVSDEDNVEVLRVKVSDVFQGQTNSFAVIEGLWMINWKNIKEIENDETFGELEANIESTKLKMDNDDAITLSKDSTVDIANGIQFKVADNNTLRYYPFVEQTIGENSESPNEDTEPVEDSVERKTDEPADGQNSTEKQQDQDTGEELGSSTEEQISDNSKTETGNEPKNGTDNSSNQAPGFEAVFAIAGLLSIAFLIKHNK